MKKFEFQEVFVKVPHLPGGVNDRAAAVAALNEYGTVGWEPIKFETGTHQVGNEYQSGWRVLMKRELEVAPLTAAFQAEERAQTAEQKAIDPKKGRTG